MYMCKCTAVQCLRTGGQPIHSSEDLLNFQSILLACCASGGVHARARLLVDPVRRFCATCDFAKQGSVRARVRGRLSCCYRRAWMKTSASASSMDESMIGDILSGTPPRDDDGLESYMGRGTDLGTSPEDATKVFSLERDVEHAARLSRPVHAQVCTVCAPIAQLPHTCECTDSDRLRRLHMAV